MIKKNIPMIIITSLITLLPAILMKSGMPLILLLVHLFCIFVTGKDRGNQNQNQTLFRLVFWICPILALYTSGINYLVITGKYDGMEEISLSLLGVVFAVIGYHLPKCKMNATIGIKVPWAYSSDENWNRTHQFGGKVWLVCGLLMIFMVFLPANIGAIVLTGLIFIMILVPTVYSYLFYKKEMQEGKASLAKMSEEMFYGKKHGKIAGIFTVAIIGLVAILMFAGNIDFICEEERIVIKADFYGDMAIDYDEIESVKYLEEDVQGARTNGYGSAKLLMGTFRNEDYGYYTRYSYTKCDVGIELNLGESVIVISDIDEDNTQKLYEEIVSVVNK